MAQTGEARADVTPLIALATGCLLVAKGGRSPGMATYGVIPAVVAIPGQANCSRAALILGSGSRRLCQRRSSAAFTAAQLRTANSFGWSSKRPSCSSCTRRRACWSLWPRNNPSSSLKSGQRG